MVAWANHEALERSFQTGELHFWSRSRGELWKKGETSGNLLELRSLHADCDGDTVLARVRPTGPACHPGETTCFGEMDGAPGAGAIAALWAVIDERARTPSEGSYTTRLLGDENLRLKKLGEETAELIAALARGQAERVPEEAADLLYHMLVALRGAGVELDSALRVLADRRR
jgi:phosphoribosyl-ATP pyrophosphohydrolase/phosphoribosyl-AMP cyclohydrolase